MDTTFYSDKTILEFVKKSLCQGDQKLYKHYINGDVGKFRERLSRKFTEDQQDNLEQVVYCCVTDCIRDIILETVGVMSKQLHSCGDLIITGGEAFNMYLTKEDRIITSDIDTKFIPVFKGQSGGLVSTKSPKYFGFLQSTKLKLWDIFGQTARDLNFRIKKRIESIIKNTKIGKMLGISFPTSGPWVTRRYSLIQKKRQDLRKDDVIAKDVLIDVELFALDLKLKYYSIEKKRVLTQTLGGILDTAIMRPYEVGYEIAFSRHQGVMYKNKDTGLIVHDKNILFAGKRFLVEDVYLMQLLGLRPHKTKKDRKRLFVFATKVLRVKNIRRSDGIDKIFRKCLIKIKDIPRSTIKRRPFFKINWSQNPEKYKRYTTEPRLEPLMTTQILGLKSSSRNMNIPGYNKSSGPYRFDLNKKKWLTNNSRLYIKNEMTHRPIKAPKNIPKIRLRNILYGYNPRRDSWMPEVLVNKAAMIPIVGLKNTSFIY
jgi:hypothetical protein